MAAATYMFYPHFNSFALSFSLLLNLFFHKYHWLATISKYQTKKLNNTEKLNVSFIIFYVSTIVIHYDLLFTRTNLKLHKIPITLKLVKKVMTNLDSSKVSGPDCIEMLVEM